VTVLFNPNKAGTVPRKQGKKSSLGESYVCSRRLTQVTKCSSTTLIKVVLSLVLPNLGGDHAWTANSACIKERKRKKETNKQTNKRKKEKRNGKENLPISH
jgi:hypothetical protein